MQDSVQLRPVIMKSLNPLRRLRSRSLARLRDVSSGNVPPILGKALNTARRKAAELSDKMVGSDFEERVQWLRARYQAMGGDPFGLDPEVAQSAVRVLAFFHRLYFRTESQGLQNLPEGRCLLVANHGGQIPIDGALVGSALFLDANPPRVARAMIDTWAATLPFVSTFYNQVGQVVGVPENARKLLEMGEALLVFPEGTRGISKPFNDRYRLQDFGHGFMRLAIETNTPIVPVAIVGAEEQYVNLGNVEWAAKALGIPAFPVMPQLLVPGGQLPLPIKYRLRFGEPLTFRGAHDADERIIGDKVWLVKQTIQNLLNQTLDERSNVFF
ncbi:MAG: acyltransferase family protein [Polyangiaceae bacterium]|nr:acyltransferase family protein [Polyangiaceae bacterium]